MAGATGALNLSRSDRSSHVSGAATGMLVAAPLAPPAGTIGMASAIGEWDLVKSGVFILLPQLVGINLSGAVVFGLFGLTPKGRATHGAGDGSGLQHGRLLAHSGGCSFIPRRHMPLVRAEAPQGLYLVRKQTIQHKAR